MRLVKVFSHATEQIGVSNPNDAETDVPLTKALNVGDNSFPLSIGNFELIFGSLCAIKNRQSDQRDRGGKFHKTKILRP